MQGHQQKKQGVKIVWVQIYKIFGLGVPEYSSEVIEKDINYIYVCMVITYSRVWINRVRLPILLVVSWTGKKYSPVPVRAWEFGLARRVQPSRPASACSSPHSGWIWCLLTGFLPSSAAASIYETAIRHRVSPKFIGSRNCVPMAFTAESPPAQGQ